MRSGATPRSSGESIATIDQNICCHREKSLKSVSRRKLHGECVCLTQPPATSAEHARIPLFEVVAPFYRVTVVLPQTIQTQFELSALIHDLLYLPISTIIESRVN